MKAWYRLNEPDERESEVVADPRLRAHDMLNALFAVSGELDVKIGIGQITKKTGVEPAVVLEFDGRMHGFSVLEALELADMMNIAITKFPNDQWADVLSDFILALRMAAQASENEFKER